MLERQAIGGEAANRRHSGETVLGPIEVGKVSLPGVRVMTFTGCDGIAPVGIPEGGTATGGILPLGLGRQLLACPADIRLCVGKADLGHRLIIGCGG